MRDGEELAGLGGLRRGDQEDEAACWGHEAGRYR